MTTPPDFNPKDYPDEAAAQYALLILASSWLNEQEQFAARWHNEQLARIRRTFDKPRLKTTDEDTL